MCKERSYCSLRQLLDLSGEQRMDSSRVPRRAVLYQYGVGIIAGIGAMSGGAWVAWPSVSIKPLLNGENCCNVSRSEISTMVSLMDLGNFLTPIPASYCMDKIGRKPTFYSTALMYLVASTCVLIADNIWYIYVARLFAGMAKGIAFAVVPIYLAEMANVQIRGALSTMFIGFLSIGMLYNYFLGVVLSYDALNIANAVIPVIFIFIFFPVPESPYYLTMKRKEKRAVKSLSKYRQMRKDNESLLSEAKMISVTVAKELEQKGRFIDLFTSGAMRRATMIISLLALFQRSLGLSPALAFSTITLPEDGGGLSREKYMVIFSFVIIVSNYLATALIETWGRKKLLIYSCVSTTMIQTAAGLFYYCQSHEYDVTSWLWVPYACLISLAFSYSIGIGFIPSTLVGELFPANVKSHASSLSAIILAGTSFVINRLFREVADRWGVEYMYLLFVTSCILCTVFCLVYVFETKGKTFAEIQIILKIKSGEIALETLENLK